MSRGVRLLCWVVGAAAGAAVVALFVLVAGVRSWALTVLVAAVTAAATSGVGFAIGKARQSVAAFAGLPPIVARKTLLPTSVDGFRWVVPVTAEELPDDSYTLDAWARERGGMLAHFHQLEVLVEGRDPRAVVLLAVRVVITRRTPAEHGIHVYRYGEVGAIVSPRVFNVDLDCDPPSVRPAGDDAPAFPFAVTPTDPEMFLFRVTALDADYDWFLELDWTLDGTTGTYIIDDRGVPFRIAAVGSRPEYRHEVGLAGWQRVDGTVERARQRGFLATERQAWAARNPRPPG